MQSTDTHKRFTLEYGVKGAYRVSTREYDDAEEAFAKGLRWSKSNSTGDYWAILRDADTGQILRCWN